MVQTETNSVQKVSGIGPIYEHIWKIEGKKSDKLPSAKISYQRTLRTVLAFYIDHLWCIHVPYEPTTPSELGDRSIWSWDPCPLTVEKRFGTNRRLVAFLLLEGKGPDFKWSYLRAQRELWAHTVHVYITNELYKKLEPFVVGSGNFFLSQEVYRTFFPLFVIYTHISDQFQKPSD